uniref:Protein FAM217B n=1 Tax=Neogobius melanostomus TaxID=47308 RepID=A0A8C6T9Y1_9GOBI
MCLGMGTILQQRVPQQCTGRRYREPGWAKATTWSDQRPEVDSYTDKLLQKSQPPQTTQENIQKSLNKRKQRSIKNRMSKHSSQITKSQPCVPPPTDQSPVLPTVINKKKHMHSKSKRHTAAFPCHRSLSDSSPDPAPRLSALRESGDLRDDDSDTDISESETLSQLPCGGPPPQLDLRPDVITSEEPIPISRRKKQPKFDFPDFLPPPFNSWSLNQLAIFYNMDSTRSASRSRPTGPLERYMERLLQLEWYQIQTLQDNCGTAHAEPLSSSHKALAATSARLSTPKCILQCQRAFPLTFLSSAPSHCAYIVCSSRNSSCCRPSGCQARPARFSPTQERIVSTSQPKRSYSESRAPLLDCSRKLSNPVRSQGHLKQMQAAGNLRTPVQAVNKLPSTAKDQGPMGKDHFEDYRTVRPRSGSEHRKTNTERQHNCTDTRRGRSECRKGRAERRAQQEIKPDAVTAIMANLPATKYCAVNRRARSKQVEFVT